MAMQQAQAPAALRRLRRLVDDHLRLGAAVVFRFLLHRDLRGLDGGDDLLGEGTDLLALHIDGGGSARGDTELHQCSEHAFLLSHNIYFTS